MIKNNKKIKEAIVKKLDLKGFSSVQQDKIISKILENVSLKASILLLDKLNEKERAQLALLKGSEKMMKFFNKRTIDIYLVVDRAITEVISDLKKLKH